MKRIISFLVISALLLFAGCSDADETANSSSGALQNNDNTSVSGINSISVPDNEENMFTDRDINTEYSENDSVIIKLNGNSASASAKSVKISGSTVTITENKTHIISGNLSDGMIIVDADSSAKLQLVFKGVNIISKSSAALYIKEADKVFITLNDGTENTLENAGAFTQIDDSNIDAALFSKQDITFNGSGSLTVNSPVGHGIVCKDDLVITGGKYTINSASHGIDANDSIRLSDCNITVDSGKDAVHAENSEDASLGFIYISNANIKAEAEGDGISANSYMNIKSGNFEILAGGGSQNGSKEHSDSFGDFMGGGGPQRPPSAYTQPTAAYNQTETDDASTSMKGLKTSGDMLVSGGTFIINSADDALHSNASLKIQGGTFSIATGDDAIHAEQTLTVSSGTVNITENYEGLEALDIQILGGDIKLKATDDGLNAAGGNDQSGTAGGRDGMFGGPQGMGGPKGMSANSNGSIKISAGKLYINASGDGIDANGTLEISGGHITVTGPTRGDTATLDYDKSGIITGGTFIGTGASSMAQSFSDSTQGIIALNVGNQSANTRIIIKNSKGKEIINHTPELDFALIILSSPEMIKGEKYTVTVGSKTGEYSAG